MYIIHKTLPVLKMRVLKRNNTLEDVSFDKVIARIQTLCDIEPKCVNIDPSLIAQKVCARIYDGVKTTELDELAAQITIALCTTHLEYGTLAGRIIISNNHKNTTNSFSETVTALYNEQDAVSGKLKGLISKSMYEVIQQNKERLNAVIDHQRDYDFDFFAFKTLEKAYLMKVNGKIVERIQYMFMRVALGIHGEDIEDAINTYELMSSKAFIHATPTLFHSGCECPQLLSCFLLGTDDSVDGIYKTIADCAMISKWAGGIGVHVSNIRSNNTVIRGTHGKTSGIVPMLRVYNETARYINQSGKRNGSFAVYLSPWHDDIFEFMDLRKNHGDENARARDLFYAMWISDLFMRKVKLDEDWYTFNPDDCRDLDNTFGAEFEEAFNRYVEEGKYVRKMKARSIWMEILKSQMETGTPYMLYKDACNEKSNQQNLGVIKSSNLCVSPDTMVLTKKGHHPIQNLENEKVEVWNGKEFSDVVVKKTGNDQELITISFSNGQNLTCTKYHKFYIQQKYFSSTSSVNDVLDNPGVHIVEARNLKSGMKIVKCDFPVIDNDKVLKNAYTNGFFTGDGTYQNKSKNNPEERPCGFKSVKGTSFCKRHAGARECTNGPHDICQGISYQPQPAVSLYDEKIDLLKNLAYRSHGVEKNKKLNVMLSRDLEEKFHVPTNYSLQSKLDWFAGLCDADGCVVRNQKNQSLQVSSIHKEFLIKVMLMLQTCGVSSKVTLGRNKENRRLPNGRGGYAIYNTKSVWRLLVASTALQKLTSLGFSPHRLEIESHTPKRSSEHFVTITDIEDKGEINDTFCFTEKKRHAGLFNGIFTSQCAEIIEYSDKEEYACCTLASVGLPSFVKPRTFAHKITMFSKPNCSYCDVARLFMTDSHVNFEKKVLDEDYTIEKLRNAINSKRSVFIEKVSFPQFFVGETHLGGFNELVQLIRPVFDFDALRKTVHTVTKNLNKVIDMNYYPVAETEVSNKRHRPIGIGVQGLADVYSKMRMPFDSDEAHRLNKEIFATIYYAAVETSCNLAKEQGKYSTYENSPMSQGKFQFDLWSKEPLGEVGHTPNYKGDVSTRLTLDWDTLRSSVKEHGQRNSLLIALMPTASTSQILGNNECIEPYTSTIYVRRTMAGDFVVVNKHLIADLCALGLWDEEMKNRIVMENGSIQNIDTIPIFLRKLYKVVWDLSQKTLIDQAADRGIYVCQSQSLNLFVEKPTAQNMSSMHFYAWSKGLKTGMYYLRTRAAAKAQQFTVDPRLYQKYAKKEEVCESCSG